MLSSSAETVVNIEELLKQILERVPALSLITFKCISKHWLSLISDPEFLRCHTLRNHNPKISSFFPTKIKDENLLRSPFKTLNSAVTEGSNIGILQSCNGLFLCYALSGEQTKHHCLLPPLSLRWSKTFRSALATGNQLRGRDWLRYFGECGGRLYLTETYEHCLTQFDVMEMERDYSSWFVKYNVDLNPLAAALPGQDWDPLIVLCLSQEEETYNTGVEDTSVALLLHLPDFLFHITKWRLTAFFISSSPSKETKKANHLVSSHLHTKQTARFGSSFGYQP
ncbi:hypothetical protein ACLB2K_062942 [Fragaria x ananassa]